MKDLLIINSNASKGRGARSQEEILTALAAEDIHPQVIFTECPMHAAELTEKGIQNDGIERIFAAGGDGTLNEAVNGIISAQKKGLPSAKLAIIPNGRGNDFVSGLNLPRDLKTVASMIRQNRTMPIDIGVAGDGTFERYFANGSGFGIESAINYYATLSPLNGKASYLYGIAKAIRHDLHQQEVHITADGKEIDTKIVLFTAMNGRQEGGGFPLAPDFSLQDGMLDLCFLGDGLPALRVISLLPRLASGKLDHPDIHTMKVRSVHVQLKGSKSGLFSQVDGETIIKNGFDFYASVSPYKVDLIVP